MRDRECWWVGFHLRPQGRHGSRSSKVCTNKSTQDFSVDHMGRFIGGFVLPLLLLTAALLNWSFISLGNLLASLPLICFNHLHFQKDYGNALAWKGEARVRTGVHQRRGFPQRHGSLITATIRKNLVNKFNYLLKEGNAYVLKNFKVVENSGSFKAVDSELKIIFTLLTKVEKVDETQVPSIPMYGFQFACQKTITERLNNDTILTDIIGCLTLVGDVETVRGGFRKRDLEIIPEFNVTCKVTLWGVLGESFVDSHIEKNPSGVTLIIIVTSTRVTKFQGVLNFRTSSASKVYVNLKTDYVLELAKRFAHICPRLNLGVSSGKAKKTLEEEMFENRMDIHQLLQTDWSDKPKGYIITILGVIEDIGTQYGWFYLGCQGCCRKVNPVDGVYTCASCNVEYKNALTLYKLHLLVRDDTDVVTCVVLHKLAEKMIDSSPLKLLNKSDPNKKELPHEITSLCGQKFVFCLQLSEYNIKYGSDMFTVVKVFDPDHVLEKKHKSVDATVETVANDEESLNATDGTQPSKISTSTTVRKRKLILNDDETDT